MDVDVEQEAAGAISSGLSWFCAAVAEAADASTTITAAAVVDVDAEAETDVTLSGLSCFCAAAAVVAASAANSPLWESFTKDLKTGSGSATPCFLFI